MSLINFSNIQDTTTIDANDVNSPMNTIYNDYNGNIDSTNIKPASITNAAIGLAAVKSQNIDFTTLNFGNYTTAELDTGFTWIDGKHIYKLTTTQAVTGSGSEQVINNVMNSAATLLIDVVGVVYNSTDMVLTQYMNPAATTLQNFQLKIQKNSGAWRAAFFTGITGNVHITTYYVK